MEEFSPDDFVLTRIFNAPRELVFAAWSEVEHLKHWWGPKGFTLKVAELDFREGGTFHYCLNMPNGGEMWGKFQYIEIVAPEKLVLINSFSDAEGGLTRHPMSETWPLEVYNIYTFTDLGGRTEMTLRSHPHGGSDVERQTFLDGRKGMEGGFGGMLDTFDAYLASIQS